MATACLVCGRVVARGSRCASHGPAGGIQQAYRDPAYLAATKAVRLMVGLPCRWCGKPMTALGTAHMPSVDHVVALADGGSNAPANLTAAGLACNKARARH